MKSDPTVRVVPHLLDEGTPTSTARDILLEAAALVGGDRARTHGDKTRNHAAIAAVWNGYLEARTISGHGADLTALDAANLMELLKVARRLNGSYNPDDYLDGAGYAAVAGEIAAKMASRSDG